MISRRRFVAAAAAGAFALPVTARALGITVPQSVLLRADEVIE